MSRKNLVLNEDMYQYISLHEENLISNHHNSDFRVMCHILFVQIYFLHLKLNLC